MSARRAHSGLILILDLMDDDDAQSSGQSEEEESEDSVQFLDDEERISLIKRKSGSAELQSVADPIRADEQRLEEGRASRIRRKRMSMEAQSTGASYRSASPSRRRQSSLLGARTSTRPVGRSRIASIEQLGARRPPSHVESVQSLVAEARDLGTGQWRASVTGRGPLRVGSNEGASPLGARASTRQMKSRITSAELTGESRAELVRETMAELVRESRAELVRETRVELVRESKAGPVRETRTRQTRADFNQEPLHSNVKATQLDLAVPTRAAVVLPKAAYPVPDSRQTSGRVTRSKRVSSDSRITMTGEHVRGGLSEESTNGTLGAVEDEPETCTSIVDIIERQERLSIATPHKQTEIRLGDGNNRPCEYNPASSVPTRFTKDAHRRVAKPLNTALLKKPSDPEESSSRTKSEDSARSKGDGTWRARMIRQMSPSSARQDHGLGNRGCRAAPQLTMIAESPASNLPSASLVAQASVQAPAPAQALAPAPAPSHSQVVRSPGPLPSPARPPPPSWFANLVSPLLPAPSPAPAQPPPSLPEGSRLTLHPARSVMIRSRTTRLLGNLFNSQVENRVPRPHADNNDDDGGSFVFAGLAHLRSEQENKSMV